MCEKARRAYQGGRDKGLRSKGQGCRLIKDFLPARVVAEQWCAQKTEAKAPEGPHPVPLPFQGRCLGQRVK